jgi:hypothetical protein
MLFFVQELKPDCPFDRDISKVRAQQKRATASRVVVLLPRCQRISGSIARMARVKETVWLWVCERCGHKWLPRETNMEP